MGLAVNEGEKPGDRQSRSLYNLLLHKGYALHGLHQYEKAVGLYEAMAAGTFEVRTVIPVARCLLDVGHPAKGIAMLRRAHAGEVDPQPFHPLTMDLLQANGDIREAYALYRKRPISLALAKAFNAENAAKDADLVCSLLDILAELRPDRQSFRTTKRSPLKPLPQLQKYWASKTKASRRVNIGLSWRSMLQSVARDRHYLTVKELGPLAKVDADFWLFQPRVTQEEIDYLRSFLTLHIPEDLDLVNDLEGQLGLAANPDYVISPFATTGELAGAVGTPTFLVSTTKSTTWRRNPDGSDIWHAKTQIVTGDPSYETG